MNRVTLFFLKLTSLSLVVLGTGVGLMHFEVVVLPTMFYALVGFYFSIATIAFMVNLKALQKESEIAVWYYMSSIMFKFLMAAILVTVLTKFYPAQKRVIVFTNFALYPLFGALVILDVYKRIRL